MDTKAITSTNDAYLIQIASELSWATVACVKSATDLFVTSGRISPFYTNSSEVSYTCFTKLHKDLVFGSTIDGAKANSKPIQSEQNLVNGFYMGDHDQCMYYGIPNVPKWILFDFGEPKTFTHVVFETIHHGGNAYFQRAGKIWYGNSSSTGGDFSKFNSPKYVSSNVLILKTPLILILKKSIINISHI